MAKQCAGKHVASPCTGPASILCGSCGAVRYCSPVHQRWHWEEHARDCERWEKQMRLGAILHDFPFSFTQESTFLIDIGKITWCNFLEKRGLHKQGLWQAECECRHKTSSFSSGGIYSANKHLGWHLPPTMCPCTGTSNSVSSLDTWADYYSWRNLPLDSPVAILLHWPLTLYHSLKLEADRKPNFFARTRGSFRIHYLGPEKELDQLEVFGELCALLPDQHIYIDFIGPAVPYLRDGEQVKLSGFAECSEPSCKCKTETEQENIRSSVSVRIWKGLYHSIFKHLVKDSFPDFIFAPNAGISAFSSWRPTMELINILEIPAVFTDFCEEATVLASSSINDALGCTITIPVQVNPFRQPMTPPNKTLELPTYSNCFLFGIK